ncbi:MAG: dTDP-4-dehydrorhamnose 3,5-epimerase [Rhodothermales bacterium]|nr:dTDP-4-dehydrorhamnose 3,5-epimerase [Rhodothermales bacterium]
MKFEEMSISGVYVIKPSPVVDDRGFFARVWCQQELKDHGLVHSSVQVNAGFNTHAGTVRGLHFQRAPHEEVKIVRCIRGAVYDVIVDLRPGSPTYRKWLSRELTDENREMLYVPEGCAHGYQTLTDNSEIQYHTSEFYSPESATGVRYNDPLLSISWPREATMVSNQDQTWDLLAISG